MNRIANLYRNAYSGLSPATWWLGLVMLVNRSGTMVVPFMTLYLTQTMHYTIGRAGMIMALFGAGAVCGGFLGGRLTDRLGFYNIQLSALLCGGIMFIALGQMRSFPAIAGCTFLLALLNDSFRPANAAAVAQYSKEENRTRSFSLNRLSINLGWAVGGAAGGFIASHNYHLLFWIDGLTNIGAAILLRLVLHPRKNKQTPARKHIDPNVQTRSPFSDRLYLVFIFLTVLFGCMFFQEFAVLPVYYNQRLRLTPFFIGATMALNGFLVAAFEMALIFKLEQKNKNLTFIMVGVLLTGISFIIFNLLPGTHSIALLSVLFLTAGEMLAMPFMNSYWISRTDYNNRGQYAGMYTAAWSIAQIVGPYTGSQLVEHYGFATLWWIVGLVSIVAASGFRWLQKQ